MLKYIFSQLVILRHQKIYLVFTVMEFSLYHLLTENVCKHKQNNKLIMSKINGLINVVIYLQ